MKKKLNFLNVLRIVFDWTFDLVYSHFVKTIFIKKFSELRVNKKLSIYKKKSKAVCVPHNYI